MRLPVDFADEVVAGVLELFSDGEGDGAWHGHHTTNHTTDPDNFTESF
jgi:hypothetical protein